MEDTLYSAQLKRLHEEQDKALKETDEKINQWETFKSDYDALKSRLKTLPDKLSHDVMVPFGKLAFMPGQLVHTNEVLVLLGDNWFAERSAKQATEIVDRRMKTVDAQLEDLLKQRKLLQPRREFTSELQSMTEVEYNTSGALGWDRKIHPEDHRLASQGLSSDDKGSEGVVDIREEYDKEKEEKWKETHRKNVQRHRRHLKEQKSLPVGQTGTKKKQTAFKQEESTYRDQSTITDEELWARLDQLEQIELEGREMQKIGTSNRVEQTNPLDLPWSKTSFEVSEDNQELTAPGSSSKGLDSDDDDDEDGEEEQRIVGGGKIIHFQHTKKESLAVEASALSGSREDCPLESPADIYTRFTSCFGPRSILKGKTEPKKEKKKKTGQRKVAFEAGVDAVFEKDSKEVPQASRNEYEQTAFSGTVVEKQMPGALLSKPLSVATSSKSDNVETAAGDVESKPVSRFRAQRLGKNTR